MGTFAKQEVAWRIKAGLIDGIDDKTTTRLTTSFRRQLHSSPYLRVFFGCESPSDSKRPMSASGVRRDKAALSSGANPTRQPLQPEAIGAVMEGNEVAEAFD